MDLRLNDDELNACVQCGLCMPHCPTYRVTGDETMSPRGRIRLMRDIQRDDLPVTADVLRALDTCVQCRGCEPACPSGVPYGHLIEGTRNTLREGGLLDHRILRWGLKPLRHPRALRAGSSALAVAQRAGLPLQRLGVPQHLPVRRTPLRASGDDAQLFTGCVMDAWSRDVHHATQRVIESIGFGVRPTGDRAPCCGALSAHAGDAPGAHRAARQIVEQFGADRRPIIVNAAGCGAHLKDYGRILGTEDARAFSSRVFDVAEWLAARVGDLPPMRRLPLRVAVQDPCHLRHVQRVHAATRTVLAAAVEDVVELDDDGLCCGAGGAYSLLEPELASAMRKRKLAAVERSGADIVASANPGCAIHLAAGATVVHTVELVELAMDLHDDTRLSRRVASQAQRLRMTGAPPAGARPIGALELSGSRVSRQRQKLGAL